MSYEDLPLFPEADPRPGRESASTDEATETRRSATPTRPDSAAPGGGGAEHPAQRLGADRLAPSGPRWRAARFTERLGAGLLDCLVLLGGTLIVALGALLAGARLGVDRWPPLALFLAAFSFVYAAVPLAFWGQTPGMAMLALIARRPGQAPLTFRQAAVRWLASWLTVLLAGLPFLLALTGASLADRMSGSATLRKLG